jgi:signal transduction histidine kinase
VGFSQLMASRPMGPEQTRELAVIFHRQSTALNALVGDLMELARLDARGARDFRWRSLAVATLVDDAVQAAALPALARLKVAHQQPDALLRADAGKAALALCQVLTHACRQGQGGAAIELHTRAAVRAGRPGVDIVVRDDGPGMTREELNGAFDRFYRGGDRATQGTGLGLSLAKAVVELHGGSVALTSAPGQGTQLTLWWPAAVAARQVAGDTDTAIDATHFPALVTGPSSGANCPGVPPARARRPRRSPPANLLKGGSDEPDDQRAPPRSHPRAA